jgi:hypothetical protein
MCCFSQPVPYVAKTRIFARPTIGNRQVVVYQMQFEAEQELAMILPVPFQSGADPKEFKFIDLSAYPQFFADFKTGFQEIGRTPNRMYATAAAPTTKLEVFQVGSFEASFVPTLADFNRLDQRFRIESDIWRKLPGYDRMAFAVFKLKPGRQEVHPMAFAFPRENPKRLFYPTLHIHDGTAHLREEFDHELYGQGNDQQAFAALGWEESVGVASQFMKSSLTAGILHNNAHAYRRQIRGPFKNEDIYVDLT